MEIVPRPVLLIHSPSCAVITCLLLTARGANIALSESDGKSMLVKNDGSGNFDKVTSADLNWSEWLKWTWWKYQHPPQPMLRPRATWAQMLRALGLDDVGPIIR